MTTATELETKHYPSLSPIHVFVEEQAAPVRLQVSFAPDKMREVMDERFNKFVADLSDGQRKSLLKGGYREITRERVYKRTGGMVAFYSDIFYNEITRYFSGTGQEVLTTASLEADDVGHAFVLQSLVYLEPTVAWKHRTPATFRVNMAELSDKEVDNRIAHRLSQIQESQAVYTPVLRTNIGPLDYLTVTLETFIDGVRSSPFSWTEQKIQLGGNGGQPKPWFLEAELQKLVDVEDVLKVGPWPFDFTPPKHDGVDEAGDSIPVPFGGQRIHGSFQIHKIQTKEVPKIDDDLAVSAGYESLAQLTGNLKKEVEDAVIESRERHVLTVIQRALLDQSTIGPVPELWATRKAAELIEIQLSAFNGSEQKMLNRFGIKSRDQLMNIMYNELRQQLRLQLAERSWGITHGIEGNKTLNATHQYAAAVEKHILNTVELLDVPENSPVTVEPWWPVSSGEAINDGASVDPEE